MKILLIFVICALWCASAKRNTCCPDDAPLSHNIMFNNCSNEKKLWIRDGCEFGAYLMPEEEYELTGDDTITFLEPSNTIIPQDKYCLGYLEQKDVKIAMVCFPNVAEELAEGQMSYLARLICCSLSVICLAVTLIVYVVLPNLRDLQGKCMMATLFSLLMAFLFLSVVQQPVYDEMDKTCIALASLLYFWFMCVFFWLNVVSFNMWRSVVRPKLLTHKKYIYCLYNAYGWGGPLLFLMIVLICHHVPGDHIKPNFGVVNCWFSGSQGVRAFFYGPIFALIILNIIMFISTAWTLSKQNKFVAEHKHRSHKFKFCLYLKLFIIMGICWVFEPMSELLFVEGSYVWIVTDYINSLQGLIIFLLLVVFRKRVRRDLARRSGLFCRRLPKEWATMPDEDCEELEEDVDEITSIHHENNEQQVNRTP